jgi:hypothetical protein
MFRRIWLNLWLRGFIFSLSGIGGVEARPLKNYRHWREDTLGVTPAPRTGNYWIIIEALLQLKSVMAIFTLIFVDRHKVRTSYSVTNIILALWG